MVTSSLQLILDQLRSSYLRMRSTSTPNVQIILMAKHSSLRNLRTGMLKKID